MRTYKAFFTIGIAACALGMLAAPAPAAQASASATPLAVPPLAYKSRKLANGLTIISMRDTTTPNVVVSV